MIVKRIDPRDLRAHYALYSKHRGGAEQRRDVLHEEPRVHHAKTIIIIRRIQFTVVNQIIFTQDNNRRRKHGNVMLSFWFFNRSLYTAGARALAYTGVIIYKYLQPYLFICLSFPVGGNLNRTDPE